jgi:hypothetical protein
MSLTKISDETIYEKLAENPSLDTLFCYLFGSNDYAGHAVFKIPPSDVICQTTWGKGGVAFRCLDCEKDTNCVVCSACFFDSHDRHETHRVKLIRTSGGCCDCGDIASWSADGFCSRHGPPKGEPGVHQTEIPSEEMKMFEENSRRIFPLVIEIITRSITTDVHKELASLGFQFLSSCIRVSLFRPYVLTGINTDTIGTWIQVCCVLSGKNPRPRPPVTCVPSREDCGDIAEFISEFFLSMVQISPEFKISFSRVYLCYYGEIIRFKGDISDSSRGDLGSLSVQLFTIPDVCEALLSDGLVSVLLSQLENLMSSLKDDQTGRLSVRDVRPDIDLMIWRVIHDFGYCLHHERVCSVILSNRPHLEQIIKCLSPLHHANVQSIKHGDHVLYENTMWRTAFRLEQLFHSILEPLYQYCRRSNDISLLIMVIVGNLGAFDLQRLGGENGSFHCPIVRILGKCMSFSRIEENESSPLMTKEVLRQIAIESIRPQLMSIEADLDVWVRNGDSLRYQSREYQASFKHLDSCTLTLALCMMDKAGMDPMAELIRCTLLLMADIPDDTTNSSTVLKDRQAFFSNDALFEIDHMDDWFQLFLRDVVIGGSGHAIDRKRRISVFHFIFETICRVTSDSTHVELAHFAQRTDPEIRRSLITKCLVSQMPGQRFSYSQVLNSLPPLLRQPEYLVDQVLELIGVRERSDSGSVYKLNSEGLKLYDITYRVMSPVGSDMHAVEEFGVKNTNLIGPRDIERDSISSNAVSSLIRHTGFLPRILTGILRARLSHKYYPNCLGEAEMSPAGLDGVCILSLKIIDNLRSTKEGLRMLENASEAHIMWTRPPFGIPMRLKGLIQRTDLNGLEGIYYGKQDGRLCITMAEEGKLLAKESNAESLTSIDPHQPFAITLIGLLEELSTVIEISEVCGKLVKVVLERLCETTGSVLGSPVTSQALMIDENVRRASLAKERQALLMQKMRAKQDRFKIVESSYSPSKEDSSIHNHHECAMCREIAKPNDPIVAIGYCAPGNTIARLSPPGTSVASPASPYVSACMHTVHQSCWETHSSSDRNFRGDSLLVRADEVQCPVCRSLANVVIPALSAGDTITDEVAEGILDLGQALLNITREALDEGIDATQLEMEIENLWLHRESAKPWRPIILPPSVDALIEATLNELLLSISITPNKILSSFSLPSLLVRCTYASMSRRENDGSWNVWERSPREAETIDCSRLFLEAGYYTDRIFMKQVMCLRHMQLGNSEDYHVEMSRLGMFIAWVSLSMASYSASDINRIGYLPEDPEAVISVIESVLDIPHWREAIPSTLMINPASAPQAVGGVVPFINLPKNLVDLIKLVIDKPCIRCKQCPQDPAVCLLCGELVCLDADCCKSDSGEGECTQHAKKCGAGQGVFVLPYASVVVAVGHPRNCIWEGPYEDSHGEPDSYLKRSCKLTLSQHRLDQMRMFYTRGTIPMEIVKQNQITGRYVPRQL